MVEFLALHIHDAVHQHRVLPRPGADERFRRANPFGKLVQRLSRVARRGEESADGLGDDRGFIGVDIQALGQFIHVHDVADFLQRRVGRRVHGQAAQE
ncbi:hypothetical protein G6F65_022177 [Rhizopus arrhizus]|nr:hypothetical protein G6F23_015775 [Rhizopus arrhizus]KAG1243800.1 hypothetical protein G6F65_022177 [Rhizopus arrhizus]